MSINKNGIIQKENIYESLGTNQLNGTHYTKENPYILSSTSGDAYVHLDNECKVTPGKTYYLLCQCDKDWSPSHGYSTESFYKATFWLYLNKTYDQSNWGYDLPACFTSKNMTANGIWRYTIPSGYNMARVRLNSYSDGSQITLKFWDIAIIPEEYYVSITPPTNFCVTYWDKLCFNRGDCGILGYRKVVA